MLFAHNDGNLTTVFVIQLYLGFIFDPVCLSHFHAHHNALCIRLRKYIKIGSKSPNSADPLSSN